MKEFFTKHVVTICLLVFALVLTIIVSAGPGRVIPALENNFFVSHIRAERQRVKNRASVITLNHFIPRSYNDLGAFLEDSKNANKLNLRKYIDYYEKIAQYMPQQAAAHSMLGFCYYQSGRKEEAIISYEKAAALNPHIFNFHYNLGVVYFNSGHYEKAVEVLSKAMATQPTHTILLMRSSKIYQDIMRGTRDFDYSIQDELKAGYKDCRLLLALSQYYSKNLTSSPQGKIRGEQLSLRIF